MKTDLEHSKLSLNFAHEQLHQHLVKTLRAFLDNRLQLLQLTFQLLAQHSRQRCTVFVKKKVRL